MFQHRNPLSSPAQRQFILKTLEKVERHDQFVENCCRLIKHSENEANSTLENIGTQLVRIETKSNNFDGIVSVCGRLGWVKGVPEALTILTSKKDNKDTVKMLAQTAKEASQLTEFLILSLKSGQPNPVTWLVTD